MALMERVAISDDIIRWASSSSLPASRSPARKPVTSSSRARCRSNGESDTRRGRQLHKGDVITVAAPAGTFTSAEGRLTSVSTTVVGHGVRASAPCSSSAHDLVLRHHEHTRGGSRSARRTGARSGDEPPQSRPARRDTRPAPRASPSFHRRPGRPPHEQARHQPPHVPRSAPSRSRGSW